MLFQNKNPHNELIIDPTSNSEYSNKNVSISSENSEPSQEPENDLLLLCKQKKNNHNTLTFSTLNINSIPNKLERYKNYNCRFC